MSVDEWIREAQERTGLEEFDSDSFREPLGLLVESVEARSLPGGRLHDEAIDALANRLRVADHLRRHPELEDAPLDVPVIVMGMPRTGTTIVSYLLDCDPRWRSLLNWEAVDSVPPPTTATLRSDPRCVAKKQLQESIVDKLPFSPPHWEWADGPTECIFLQAQDFKALSWDAYAAYRPYADYMLHCDMTSAYDYQKKAMRVLQSQAPGRWALKMPSHALHFEWALKAFPDARFVWTHRNPYKTLASLGTTISAGHLAARGEVDREYIHDVYPEQLAEHVNRPMRARDRLPDDKILDVYCADFVADPIAGMRRVYDWLGEELEPGVEKAMRDWLEADAARQSQRPSYSLDDYGWTRDEVAPLFEEYLARYPRAEEA